MQLEVPAADPRPAALPPAGDPPGRRWGLYLYALHLLTIWSIAASNVLLGLTVLSAPWSLRGRRLAPPAARPLLVASGLYVLWLVASILASYEPVISLRATSELFSLTTLVLGLGLVRDDRQARRLVDGLVAVAAGIALSGLGQYLLGYGGLDNRIRGPLSHYMTFSGVLVVADGLLLARLALPGRGRGGGRWAWRWVALVVINVALLGSLTRSAWVGLVAALLVLALVRAPRWLALVPVVVVLFFLLAPVPILHRVVTITDLTDESNYDRICMAQAGLEMVAERPLFGLGPDLVKRRYPIYRHATAPRYTVPHLHDSFLQLAAERGLPALAAYLAMMGIAIAAAWRRLAREGGIRGPRADLFFGTVLALVAFNVAGLFENNWGDTEVQRLVLFVLVLPFVAGAGEDPGGADAARMA